MKFSAMILPIFACLLNNAVRAADFDVAKPFTCSLIQVVVCDRTGTIEKDTAEQVNLPQFIFFDVEKKMVTAKGASGDTRKTDIETVSHDHGTLILGGVQLGKAWHAVINEQTGKATITGATDDTAFILFAACTLNQAVSKEELAPTSR